MRCPKTHRYVIATDRGDSEPYDNPEKAREYMGELPEGARAVWVAFHQVGVKQLVENPSTVQTYCEAESHHQEDMDLEAGFQETIEVDIPKQGAEHE